MYPQAPVIRPRRAPNAGVPYTAYPLTTLEREARELVDQSGWRNSLQSSKIKFDDTQKGVFLEEYARTGRKGQAARAAGVCYNTVTAHVNNDPLFKEAYELAKLDYRDIVRQHAYHVAIEGVDEPIIGGKDRDQVVAHKRVYATNILALEMKRVDPTYREKSELDVTVRGAVLVIPAPQAPAARAELAQQLRDRMLEAQTRIIDVTPVPPG